MAVVAVSMEGVLTRPQEPRASFGAAHPIPEGVRLLHALKGVYEVALLTDQTHRQMVEHWLRQQNLHEFYALLLGRRPEDEHQGHTTLRLRQLERLRGASRNPVLVVESSPEVVVGALRLGIPTLLFSHPAYQRPEFRPDHNQGRAWADIVAETEQTNSLKRQDVRLGVLEHAVAAEAELEEMEEV